MASRASDLRFSDDELDALSRAERWRLISTILPCEIAPVTRRRSNQSHAHPHQELLIPLAGRAVYAHGDRAYPCAAGTVFFFDRFEPHDNGYVAEVRDATHLWISILEDRAFARTVIVLNGRMSSGALSCAVRPEQLGIDLQRAISDARLLGRTTPGLARARLLGAVAALVARIIDQQIGVAQADDHGTVQEQAIEAIKRHIAQNAGNGVTLDQLARIAGFSKFHFLRLFKKHTGTTVHRFVDQCRLARVDELRLQGLSQKDIGARLGFSCPAAYSRWKRGKR